jgi:hypothetical protein
MAGDLIERPVVIGLRVQPGDPVPVDGSIAVACARCGEPLWLSPALQDASGERVCHECVDPFADDDCDLYVSEATLLELASEDGITVDQAYARYNAECLVRFGKPLHRRAIGATSC